MAEEVIDETNEGTDDVNASAGTENTGTDVDSKTIPYDRFKAKVDESNALKKRLAEFEQAQEESERKRLEESENYKELAEKYREELEAQKVTALATRKQALITIAGYEGEQATLLTRLLEGSTDEELTESLEGLKKAFPVKAAYVDPSGMNGGSGRPAAKDGEELGASMYERIKHKLR
ncbi:hypothetical protein I2483_13655 [Sporosarcina sp. E16_3]|uniref:hypothetical protein n=1 Tax=Sporosarcina sp. E16_3 TaxID=2789293 RepID=UPI001A929CCF|nr:hypothetical protein [Sporosarcina sp. E16_3]MBO0602708.1 hypothetical protein [Sporosarcina sp. E16_3]